ncbi:ABC transporter substrate-binding protein [Flagellimonas pacifica]|uniref:Iron complex transport system substrate-binding protein n=1 Tax=Flagellimonas pacifica TaxID=1247520 RepID=A0A285MTQ2_9FLAO|nr:ABC transporter substrate-binding protein [Allomuricauda parva]SNZ00580.1 iron complex transport system substrate-binding protein [Allomuricauda parva]
MSKKILAIAYLGTLFLVSFSSCGEKKKQLPIEQVETSTQLQYATGFTIEQSGDLTIIKVISPWPGAESGFTYALVPRTRLASITLPSDAYDAIVATPVENMVITSTTHIPALESLGVLNVVSGFPNTDLISSPAARKRINDGHIKELGTNENINTEVVLELNPEVIIGFGINDTNKAYETLKRSGIPIVYNGDWTEQTPLGKAEWIKFFAPFFNKEVEADNIFKKIEASYQEAKLLTKKVTQKPTVLTGGLYKDVWYVAGGNSWMAQFLKDANANYLWANTDNKGSIGLSLEAVLEKGQKADFWFNPSLHASYEELQQANAHYEQFEAFTTKKVYSNAVKKGATGGLLFYELAPQRPDLVLKDLISILHPKLLPDYEPHFFMPLR